MNDDRPPTQADVLRCESERVAARAAVVWDEMTITLVPIFGSVGVVAIYRRALECAETEYPRLYEVREHTRGAGHFAPLLACLTDCTPEVAAATQASLLEQFDRQITLLLGESLAQRVLEFARARGEGGTTPPAPTPDEISEQLTLTAIRADIDARLARDERDQALRDSEQDELTGTANRARMLDRLKSAIAVAKRTDTPTAVLFIDLDHFKRINDDISHRAGDDMLREVATCIQGCVRETDTVCRYGGDEFVVILTPMEHRSDGEPAADRILRAIAQVRGPKSANVTLSASIGISRYPEDGTDPDALVHAADQSMYRHKRDQRDQLPGAYEDGPHAQPDPASRPGGDVPRIHAPQSWLTAEG